MFIIFIAHVPDNSWNDWIPARFGFSSGSELFVFCSGVASALAFGSIFVARGWWLGTARILHRIWQVYWAHIALFVASVALAAGLDRAIADGTFVADQFAYLTDKPANAILDAVTLRWLPPYLDILPLYVAILAMVPVMMAARRLHRLLPFALSATLYVLVWTHGINLPGDPPSGGGWFFNPFAWQLVFFAGFAFRSGWIPMPPLNHSRLMLLASGIVVLSLPVAFWGIRLYVPSLETVYATILPGNEKTDLHYLRVVHFLALAYLVLSLIDPWKDRLNRWLGAIVVMVGQQSLAAFLGSLIMARLAGAFLEVFDRSAMTLTIANLGGFVGIIGLAALVRWVKSAPWAIARPHPPAQSEAAGAVPPLRHATQQAPHPRAGKPHGHAFVIGVDRR